MGAIAGGVVGGVVGLALLAALGFFLARRNGGFGGTSKHADYVAGAPGTGGEPDLREPTLPNAGYASSVHDSHGPFASEPHDAGADGAYGSGPAYGGAGGPGPSASTSVYAPSATTAGAAGVGAGAGYYAGNYADRGATPGSGAQPLSGGSTNLPYAQHQQGGWGQQQPYTPSAAGSANPSFPPSHDIYSTGTGTGTGSGPGTAEGNSARSFAASPGPHAQGWSGLPEV